jgi:hypothetical protein
LFGRSKLTGATVCASQFSGKWGNHRTNSQKPTSFDSGFLLKLFACCKKTDPPLRLKLLPPEVWPEFVVKHDDSAY